ncbi:hypothetical protein V8C43DRAFT_285657 [Trichoderma afarasin]
MAVPVIMTRPFEAGGKGLMPTESRSPHLPPHLPPIAHGAIQSECKIMLGSPHRPPRMAGAPDLKRPRRI